MLKIFILSLLSFNLTLCGAAQTDLNTYLKTGKLLVKQSKNEQALTVFNEGLVIAKQENNSLFEGIFYLETADLLLFLNRIDSIESYYANASRVFNTMNMKPESIRARVGMLELPRRTNPSATMDQYLALLNEARTLSDKDIYYHVLDKIITVNYGMENYKEAIALSHECISYYKSTKDSLMLAMKYRYLGNVYRNSQPDSSLYYYKKVLPYFYRLQAHQLIVYTMVSLGWSLYETDLNTAWNYLMTADSIDRKYNLKSTQLPLVISFALFKKGLTKEAVVKAKESLTIGMAAKQLFVGIQSADALKDYYKTLNEIDSALHYAELSAIINDSIRSQKQYKDAGRMQAKLEYDQVLFQNELIQKEALKRNELIKNYSLLAVVLLLIIVFLIYRTNVNNQKTTKLISRQNDEKSMLLKEIHHRVKNNLTVVSGILDMQQRGLSDPNLHNVFKDAKSRISSMAMVHKTLYEQTDFGNIDTQNYFDALFKSVAETYRISNKEVKFNINTKGISLNLDTLIPLALIMNEMLTNSFKYAFNNLKEGHIKIELNHAKEQYTLLFSDNGSGLPQDFDVRKNKSLGTQLIKGLAEQIEGSVQTQSDANGLLYHVDFKQIHV